MREHYIGDADKHFIAVLLYFGGWQTRKILPVGSLIFRRQCTGLLPDGRSIVNLQLIALKCFDTSTAFGLVNLF